MPDKLGPFPGSSDWAMQGSGTVTMTSAPKPAFKFESRKKEVKTYKVRIYHNECGGELVGTGHGLTAGSTVWEHSCKRCGQIGWVGDVSYPTIAHGEDE
jgi:hypothetical protein